MQPPTDVTQLLLAYTDGDQQAMDQLVPLVYDKLRHLARARLRSERPDHTLNTTALVHEAYLRLVVVKETVNRDGLDVGFDGPPGV